MTDPTQSLADREKAAELRRKQSLGIHVSDSVDPLVGDLSVIWIGHGGTPTKTKASRRIISGMAGPVNRWRRDALCSWPVGL